MTHNITMTCQQRRQLESLTLMKGRIARIFSQKCWIYENWPWINWTWNPSQLKDYYYIVLLVKSAYHYFFFFLVQLSFFLLLPFFFSQRRMKWQLFFELLRAIFMLPGDFSSDTLLIQAALIICWQTVSTEKPHSSLHKVFSLFKANLFLALFLE